jgi:hypothetical protein
MSDNDQIAGLLRKAAALLIDQGANPFRANAYRRAADTVAGLTRSVRDIFDEGGREGLDALPGIGEGIASAIAEILVTGHWNQLERLSGTIDPLATLRSIPSVGPQLAQQIHDTLHVDTLEALEAACRDNRLATVPGIGPRRGSAITAAVTSLLDQRRISRRPSAVATSTGNPPIELVLDVDREYRERARAGALQTIAPRRFNPDGKAWLPILHANRGHWHFTALYSNTARAHELDKTHDWVVIYAYDDNHAEQQCTVVTETRRRLHGQRVIRGRESGCAAYYQRQKAGASNIPSRTSETQVGDASR